MFHNYQIFLEGLKENVFNYVPITFCIDIDIKKPFEGSNSLKKFVNIFNLLERFKKSYNDSFDYSNLAKNINLLPGEERQSLASKHNKEIHKSKLIPPGFEKMGGFHYTKYILPFCHFSGQNIWILKPSSCNRGKGIKLFKTIEELFKMIKEIQKVANEGVNNLNNRNINSLTKTSLKYNK